MRSDIRFELQNGIFFLQDQIAYKRRHIASVERLERKYILKQLPPPFFIHRLILPPPYLVPGLDGRLQVLNTELESLQHRLMRKTKKLHRICLSDEYIDVY